jgi:Zn-dependent protease with chaperone function
MNFFKAQDKARNNTRKLIVLFSLAVICLILLTNILLITALAYSESTETEFTLSQLKNHFNLDLFILASIGVCLLIFLGSLYKTISLSKGGQAIAELLGGKLVPQSTNVLEERQLLNIVEEMAIAAGMPIPKVYLLNESAINAFAAGQSHSNAVIGVTKGALTQLTRDELQGVIAHEFSHILNGDMKLNIRLMGVLHGILLIGIIGEHLVRSLRYKTSRNAKGGGGSIIMLGIGLIIVGYTGTFFGRLIKSSISRQREYLADASAVQFTRNKDSIAGALKKIGGLDEGSLLETPSAPEYSHAYFASGVNVFFESLFATHPPLAKRIRQIDPAWNGIYILPKTKQKDESEQKNKSAIGSNMAGMVVSTAILSAIDKAISQIGNIDETNIAYAHQLIRALPDSLRKASQSAYSARAIVYALLIREQKDKNNAWSLLTEHANEDMPALTKEYFEKAIKIDEQLILPLLELCVCALRELSINQYMQFKNTVNTIITSDKTIDLNEWVLQRLVLQQLDEHFSLRKPAKSKYAYLGAVKSEAEILFSLIAYIEHKEDNLAMQAFDKGKKEIGAHAFNIIPREDFSLSSLNDSLDQLSKLKSPLKPKILKACAAIILADGVITRKGHELFRTIASCLDCPVPLLNISGENS